MIGSIGLITALLSWLLLYQKQQTIDPVLRIYNRFCKKLAKRGLPKGQCEGAKDFAERIKITLPEQAASIDQITHLFIKLHYGKNAGLDDFKRFKQSVEKFRISSIKK